MVAFAAAFAAAAFAATVAAAFAAAPAFAAAAACGVALFFLLLLVGLPYVSFERKEQCVQKHKLLFHLLSFKQKALHRKS